MSPIDVNVLTRCLLALETRFFCFRGWYIKITKGLLVNRYLSYILQQFLVKLVENGMSVQENRDFFSGKLLSNLKTVLKNTVVGIKSLLVLELVSRILL